ncbi:quinol monooxygenase YgiN [Mesocricetibacter intestinalis]|uniref:Quinol monooxygenase YgiN n=1 Tax=Mesocricetibacter intestinalis TaxID=1521930 RepID=A0A4R6VFD2_9PAST|nr:putative quinol monooxygenase [Mesocricetibacter intestinalis]TDQ59562.1 quinol monooxygenase YgiN [Mesocricetibacter intestinalis]
MIIVIARFRVKPAATQNFIAECNRLITETRKEQGCISYKLHQDREQANDFAFIEYWDSKEDLERHSASAHFAEIVPQLAEMCEIPPQVQTFTEL